MRRAWGVFLLLLLAVHAVLKARAGLLPEVLWACHLASGVLALGLVLEHDGLSATGFLFHASVALPTYALHLLAQGDTNWTSALLHLLSPLAGVLAWWGRRLPAATAWWAWAYYLGMVLLSRAVTPAHLNVNLAFQPWEPWAFFGQWPSRGANALLVLGQGWMLQALWNRRGRREAAHG